MTQMQFMLFFYVLPILCGLILGMIFWEFPKTYLLDGVLLGVCVIWWCILSNINLHGSEGPGIIFWLYTHAVLTFSVVELIKFIVRKMISMK
ncbi:MAG: hypothetical protein IJW15_04985 [Clostridia bacterium]|nr:hypothetical protein [Clostridia bacterium]